jgi:hypothetical protein
LKVASRWRTAYHEAGHAVTARVLDCKFTEISIELAEGGCVWMRSAFCRMRPDIAPTTPRLRDAFEREYMTCFGGVIAQERFTGRRAEAFEYEHDAQVAEEMMQRVSSRAAERRAYHRYLIERARTELLMPPHWYAVHVLAADLVRVGSFRSRAAVEFIDAAILSDEAWTRGKRRRLADILKQP